MEKMIVLVVCALFAITNALMLEVSSKWRPNFGWEVTCEWKLLDNDSLQSVRLYRGKQQFMIYRPELYGPNRSTFHKLPDMDLQVVCQENNAQSGKCVMAMEIFQPIREDLQYTCEVSGERPTFRQEQKDINIEALVPPSDAVVKLVGVSESTGRVELNCTSSGLPAPNLVWTIGDQLTKIPQDHSNTSWNATSKLYDAWSTLSYAHTEGAICTPEVTRGRLVQGTSAQYNNAIRTGSSKIILGILTIFALTR